MLSLGAIYDRISRIRQGIVKSFIKILSFLYVRIYLIAIISLNCLLWIFAKFIIGRLSQDRIVLHYTVDFGNDLIGTSHDLYTIPILSLLITLINLLLILFLTNYKHFKFVSKILLTTCVLVNVILLVAMTTIYLVNFR